MPSKIKSRTFSSIQDNRARLTNSNIARLWGSDVGTTWTKIRIGCRISIEDSGANVTGTPRLAIGVCSGTSNIFMDATTTHFAGIVSTASFWNRITGPVGYQLWDSGSGSNFPGVAKRIGSTLTVGTLLSAGPRFFDCTAANRTAFFL